MATSSMIKPCNTCGDIGVFEAIVVCCECKVAREHLYCMREVKMHFPEWWCCDECQHNKLTSPKLIENVQKTQKLSIIIQQKTGSPSRLGFKEKWVSKGKTQYLSCDEAVKLSSGSIKSITPRKVYGSHRMSNSLTPRRVFQRSKEKTTSSGCERSPFQSPEKERNLKSNLQQPVVQQSFSPKEKTVKFPMPSTSVEGTKPEREMKTYISGLIEEVSKEHGKTEKISEKAAKSLMPCRRVEGPTQEREMKTSKNELLHPKKAADAGGLTEEVPELLKEDEKSETISGTRIDCKEANADVEAVGKPNVSMKAKEGIIDDLPPVVSEMQHDPYIPSFDSYWKGCFNLRNGPLELNESFTAHPPSKAHYKVCETAKRLPQNMCFELVPNCEIATHIFPADRDDIGLYFFPMSRMRSGHVIDFIWRNDMVLKCNVENVELFVLSSRVLPLHAQEFHGSCFLWGVFRRAKKVADFERICREPTNVAPCADAPPGFERRVPCVDVPPGFKRICRR